MYNIETGAAGGSCSQLNYAALASPQPMAAFVSLAALSRRQSKKCINFTSIIEILPGIIDF
jgi:hypothetical protein